MLRVHDHPLALRNLDRSPSEVLVFAESSAAGHAEQELRTRSAIDRVARTGFEAQARELQPRVVEAAETLHRHVTSRPGRAVSKPIGLQEDGCEVLRLGVENWPAVHMLPDSLVAVLVM